ncbi:MAG: hypothetical protein KKB70_11135 [Proteobacteria bacterium]|nr:hypothetical protein [Pseudomonadota bacterium]MBU1610939.1 hypothetical protein [Pseudomonadota bacterium]
MRILIFGKADLLGNIALNSLMRHLHEEHHLGVFLSDYVVDCEREAPLSDWLVAHERDFPLNVFFPALDALESTNGAKNLTFTALQQRYETPIAMVEQVNSDETVTQVRDYAPDVILSCRHDLIFGPEIIGIPPCGFYNLHPGSLPEYRGLSATFWTMLDDHIAANCTFYQIDPGIDTGPIVHREEISLDYSRSLIWNLSRVYLGGVQAFLRHLPNLCQGPLDSIPQDAGRSRYFSSPTADDYEKFQEKGYQVLLPEDYLEILATYLPDGRSDPLLSEFARKLPRKQDFGIE